MTDKKHPAPDGPTPVLPDAEPQPRPPSSAPVPAADQSYEPAEPPAREAAIPGAEDEAEEEALKHLKHRLKKKEAECRQLRKEKDDLYDQLLRKMADMENLKKRVEREKNEYVQYAVADFIRTILPILDNLERAMEGPPEANGPSLQEGIRLIHKQLGDALRKQGVKAIEDSVNQKFDPNLHHALATEESDEAQEPLVIEEMQKGYVLHDRLLRPALVKVRLPRKTNT